MKTRFPGSLLLLVLVLAACSRPPQSTVTEPEPVPDEIAYTVREGDTWARISEAFFGHNDFYPFHREQLQTHDPIGFELLTQVWLQPLDQDAETTRRSD